MNNKIVVDNSDDESIMSDISEEHNNDKNNKIINLNNGTNETSEFIEQCDILLEKITKNYKEQRDDIKKLIKLHKKEIRSIKKNKRNKLSKDKTGFTKASVVPDKLAEFLRINKGTEMSRTEVTSLLCKEFNSRNLYHKQDRRIIIPDDDVKKLFNLSKDSDKSNNPKDKNGLNFFNLQTHIARCYNEVGSFEEHNEVGSFGEHNKDINNVKTGKRKIITNKI